MSSNYLDSLFQSHLSNEIRLDHVLQRWIELNGQATSDGHSTPVSWKTILDVVNGPLIQNKALAKEIYQYLKQENSKPKSVTSKNSIITVDLMLVFSPLPFPGCVLCYFMFLPWPQLA